MRNVQINSNFLYLCGRKMKRMTNYLEELNESQRNAVLYNDGPSLVIAGAGSGKTRVLTYKIAYLLEQGYKPWSILALTFTNKAAREMKERIARRVGEEARYLWMGTFHSIFSRILRAEAQVIGFTSSFTIYDSSDSKSLIKSIVKEMHLDDKTYKPGMIQSRISNAKNHLVLPDAYASNAELYQNDVNAKVPATRDIYRRYWERCRQSDAMDFDDLLVYTYLLFRDHPEIRQKYAGQFRYVLVDEYQDTNFAQHSIVLQLTKEHQHVCVVGDDAQSIYSFRGANIDNILKFTQLYKGARLFKLEQNYRSTQNILNAANGVISNNMGRKRKTLWTDNEEGKKIGFKQFETGYEEAEYVAKDINACVKDGRYHYGDCAVLYRTNAQSRLFEEKFIVSNIPYKIVGGVNFYARKEIKDLLAYLKTIDNARDDLAVRRIINVPKRGIGATTLNRVADYAATADISFYNALKMADDIPTLGKSAAKIKPFVNFIQVMRSKVEIISVSELLQEIIDETGYVKELEAEDTEEAKARIENIDELISKVVAYEEGEEHPTLSGFLEEVALVADIDSLDEGSDYVVLMTLHSAKGLEFPKVYLAGMEDGLFPSYMSITSDSSSEDLEEERRLAYVGITRAKEELTITCARQRMIRGETQYNKVSRFVREIPSELLDSELRKPASARESSFGKESSFPSFLQNQTTARPKRTTLRQQPFGQSMQAKALVTKGVVKSELDYGVGDTVSHIKFGKGVVKNIMDGGRDYEVTVDFEGYGVKKMFASFAKLKRI